MSLLQIAEPGSNVSTGEAVGIDLGTTHSLIASVTHDQAQIIGNELLPSVVYFPERGKPLVGRPAQEMLAVDPTNTVTSIKRLMGVPSSAEETNMFHAVNRDKPIPRLLTRTGLLTPQEISAYILGALKQKALQHITGITGAVITVPAYFDDNQRQATKDAARLAGIPLLRLLNEPTAAALAYGMENDKDGIIAVYDFGGGTFDLTVLRLEQNVFQVLATAGDTRLGGDDADRLIANWITRHTGQPTTIEKARSIKQQLSDVEQVTVTDGLILDRHTFGEIIRPLIDRTIDLCRQAITDSAITLHDIHSIVLVGGSTRMIPVVERLHQEFPDIKIYNRLNPDTTVALGAALHAATLAGKSSDRLLLDVLPLSLGIETMGSLVEQIIPRNSTIPVSRSQEFTTWKEGQTAMLIHVVQGERDKVEDCRSLARFTLKGIPPQAAGAARVEVNFSVDADGMLQVTAVEVSTGTQAHIEVQPSSGLSETDIQHMLKEAWQSADQDMYNRSHQQTIIEAQRTIDATRKALAEDRKLLTDDEHTAITHALEQLDRLVHMHSKDTAHIEQRTRHLIQTTNDFASRRMDKAIAQALSGRSVSD